jgi:predicted Zn finger-like uncharacterized protein
LTAVYGDLRRSPVTLDLTCAECETSFEIDAQDLADDPKTLVCSNCDAKAPVRKVEALAAALEDLARAMQDLAPKFGISFTAETGDVAAEAPRPARSPKSTDVDDDDDDEESDDEDEDELEFGD